MSRGSSYLKRIGGRMVAPVLVLAAIGCGGTETPEAAEKAPAEEKVFTLGERDVAVAEVARLEAGVTISGTLEPFQVAEVKAQVPGTIVGLRVDAGNAVGRGATLGVIRAEGIVSQTSGASATIVAAEANLTLANKRLESIKSLYETGAVSKLDYDNAIAAVEAAQAQVTVARSQATGAREQASRTTVSSPLGGTVSARYVNDGEAVNPGQPLYTIVNTSVLELKGDVPIDQRDAVHVGQTVSLSLSSDPGRTVQGRIARIDPVANTATRQVGVYVQIDNPGGSIVPGQFVTGTILSEGTTMATVVPQDAVRQRETEAYVLVVDGGAIKERTVTTGTRDEARGIVAINSGLKAGEYVIIAPGVKVASGTKVKLPATISRRTDDATRKSGGK